MSESSFDREFHITDPASAKQLKEDLNNPQAVRYSKRNLSKENKKGVELLRKRFDSQKDDGGI